MLKQKQNSSGFTIIEMIVVIVILAILTTLVVVSYNAVRTRATEASLKSDLEGASAAIESDRLKNGQYATSVSALGLTPSSGNTFTYSPYNQGFCLTTSSSTLADTSYYFSSRTNKIQEGTCEGDVQTSAGSGALGNDDGTGALASIGYPVVISIGPNGNFYIGQAYGYAMNDALRVMTPQGVVTTLHNGSSFTGYGGIAVAPSGTLYVTDYNARRIKTVTPAGVVTNWAGTGVAGTDNGPIATAQFNSPQGIAFDSAGNLYVADSLNYRVRKITPGGTVSDLAGSSYGFNDATGAAAQFTTLSGLVVDSSGNVYVADWENHRIRKITPGGVVTTFAGNSTYGSVDGVGTAAQFMGPHGLAIDALDNIYVTDSDAGKVRKITPDGTVTTIVGGGPVGAPLEGDALDVRLNTPRAVAVDAAGDLYVTDGGYNRIRKFINP